MIKLKNGKTKEFVQIILQLQFHKCKLLHGYMRYAIGCTNTGKDAYMKNLYFLSLVAFWRAGT